MGRAAVTRSRPLLGRRAWPWRGWARHNAQLHQEAEHVRPTPMLSLLAVLHPEEVDHRWWWSVSQSRGCRRTRPGGCRCRSPRWPQVALGDHVGTIVLLPDDTNLSWATSSARQCHSLTRSGLPTTWSTRGRDLMRSQPAIPIQPWRPIPAGPSFPVLESKLAPAPGRPGIVDRKSTRLNSSHLTQSRMPSSA